MHNKIKEIDSDRYTLQLIKGLDANDNAFSAYVVFNRAEFNNILSNPKLNLEQYRENIVYIKKGHEVSEKEESDAREFFEIRYLKAQYYTKETFEKKYVDNKNTESENASYIRS